MDLAGLDAGAHDWLHLEAGLHLVLDGKVDNARQVDQGDLAQTRYELILRFTSHYLLRNNQLEKLEAAKAA